MRTARAVCQSLFFAFFAATLFFATVDPAVYSFPSHWFLRLNPLVALVTTIATRRVLLPLVVTGAAVAIATAFFGRFFCGFVCPLGALSDFSDRFLLKRSIAALRRPPRYLQRLKYVLLTAVVVVALSGAAFPLFFDPISLLTRITTLVAYPLLRLAGAGAVHTLAATGADWAATTAVRVPLYYNAGLAALLAALVLAGGFWDRRFWCQYVCPSGALFGVLSRYALFRRTVATGSCNTCGRCCRGCPTRAINEKDVTRTSTAECIECGVCTSLRDGCSRFAFPAPRSAVATGPDVKRRHALAGLLAGLALVPSLRATAVAKRDGHGRLMRPPGAVPEEEFLGRCIACGACMKACPTRAIQPCTPSDGFHRLFTPKIVPRIGGCEEKCHLCGYVCPTRAIRPLPLEQKRFVKIGTAVIDRHRCLAWAQNKECLVCDEICPYNAIDARVVETTKGPFKAPVVMEDYCLGCGMCEQHCPINDTAAIVVYKFGEKRLSRGDYVSPSQRDAVERWRRRSDSHLSIGTPLDGGRSAQAPAPQTQSTESALPPGFLE